MHTWSISCEIYYSKGRTLSSCLLAIFLSAKTLVREVRDIAVTSGANSFSGMSVHCLSDKHLVIEVLMVLEFNASTSFCFFLFRFYNTKK